MSASSLSFSPLESARFGLKVIRGTQAELREEDLLLDIVAHDADVAIVRLPAGDIDSAARMSRLGPPVLHADTLVYYGVDLDGIDPPSDDLAEVATAADADALRALVSRVFSDYRSHYRANPWFAPEAIRAGYEEWAVGYTAGDDASRRTWLIRHAGSPVAFATCHCDATTRIGEIVLNGVHPDHAGRGLYGRLLRQLQREFMDLGMRRLIVSTQVWNHAVQKVWARNGLALEQAFDTWHVNAMLSAGDLRLRHGLQAPPEGAAGAMAELARAVSGEFPRSELRHSSTVFSRASAVGVPRELQLRCLAPPGSLGTHAVATLRDSDGKVCVASWNDLTMER